MLRRRTAILTYMNTGLYNHSGFLSLSLSFSDNQVEEGEKQENLG